MQLEEIKKKIKEIQSQLNITSDGYFGEKSEEALKNSNYKLTVFLDFKKELPINEKLGFTDYTFEKLVNVLAAEINNPIYLAYILATIYHETAMTFKPLEEIGKGSTRKYGKVIDDVNGNQVCYCNGVDKSTYFIKDYPYLYYGRGYVQLTWFDNYKKFSKLLNVDLLNYPNRACDTEIAAKITVIGMIKGLFTGMSLKKAFKNYGLYEHDWVNARKIINGLDSAEKIAKTAKIFLKYISLK